VIESAGRSRLLDLRRQIVTARDGRALLDRKREAILRAVTERAPRLDALRRSVAVALADARSRLADAQMALGRIAVDSAALAQPPMAAIEAAETSLVGVALPDARVAVDHFVPRYGPVAVSPELDRAGARFMSLVPELLDLAAQEASVRRLNRALLRTVRRLNALDMIVLPELARELRMVTSALEEEERDEAVRRECWRGSAASPRAY
jgi:V/A-type H+/Na+-transporting ATPase subunit D